MKETYARLTQAHKAGAAVCNRYALKKGRLNLLSFINHCTHIPSLILSPAIPLPIPTLKAVLQVHAHAGFFLQRPGYNQPTNIKIRLLMSALFAWLPGAPPEGKTMTAGHSP